MNACIWTSRRACWLWATKFGGRALTFCGRSTPVLPCVVERRQQLDAFALEASVSSLMAQVSRLEARQDSTVDTLTSTMAAGGTAAAVANDMANRTMGLMSTATANMVN